MANDTVLRADVELLMTELNELFPGIVTQVVTDNIVIIAVTNMHGTVNNVVLTMPEDEGGVANLIWAGAGDANVSIDVILPFWRTEDDGSATLDSISWALNLMFPYLGNSEVALTPKEVEALKEKLSILMREAQGVDIWLAPGGVLDVNEADADAECFLDCDEEAHYVLGKLLERLGGEFTPHRESNFDNPLDS